MDGALLRFVVLALLTTDPRNGCNVLAIDLSTDTDINGSIDEHFGNLPDLERLKLPNTQVAGDIGVLRRNTKLQELDVSNTGVTGDISSLKNARQLAQLLLSNTAVFGDLAPLQKATGLKDFEVSNSSVTCPQDAPLRAVLPQLGFQDEELVNLRAMKGLSWMLFFVESRIVLFCTKLAVRFKALRKTWQICNNIACYK